jgi:hypothetical protein
MKKWQRTWGWIFLVVLGSLGIALGIIWWGIMASDNPLSNKLFAKGYWPVACTTRGCITTSDWQHYQKIATSFASFAQKEPPNEAVTLTTLIRQHLVRHGQVATPVDRADAARYREEILHLNDQAVVEQAVGVKLPEYDEKVIVPLLAQEALRRRLAAESFDELFINLARERPVWVFWTKAKWQADTAQVVRE